MWYQQNRKDAPSLNLSLANHKFLEKWRKVTIYGPPRPWLRRTVNTAFANEKGSKPEENWGTKMADNCRQTRMTLTLPGNPKIGEFQHER